MARTASGSVPDALAHPTKRKCANSSMAARVDPEISDVADRIISGPDSQHLLLQPAPLTLSIGVEGGEQPDRLIKTLVAPVWSNFRHRSRITRLRRAYCWQGRRLGGGRT